MGWGPPDCLGHLIRDKKNIVLICQCGQEYEREPMELRKSFIPLGGNCEALADLNDNMMCHVCGPNSHFEYEIVARS